MLTSSGTFKKTILGIITLIFVPVLVFVIEQKLSQPGKSNDNQPNKPPEPAVVAVQGQVMDFATKHVLEGVVVRVHVLSVDMEQTTDELGRYALSVPGEPNYNGTLYATGGGYKPSTQNLSLDQMSHTQELFLEALPPNTFNPALPRVINHAAVAQYVPRADVKRYAIEVHH